MIRVSHIIAKRSKPYLLDAGMSAARASLFLREHHIGGAPVTNNGKLVGFCSERDIVYRIVAKKRDPEKTCVKDIMSEKVLTASPDDTVEECEATMYEAHVRHLPVVKNGEVIACISLRNLLSSELSEYKLEVECLTDYIRGS
jgi:CBS domain-containing protein